MKFDIAIVGAGLVGASLAARLHGTGLAVALLDLDTQNPVTSPAWDSRIYAISPGSQRHLVACGAWQRMSPDRIARVEAMHVFGDSERAQIHFSAYQVGLPELCFIAESSAVQGALRAVNAESGDVQASYGTRPEHILIGEDSAVLQLTESAEIQSRLIVGADGAQSWVRDSLGIESRLQAYDQQGVVANFDCERPHGSIARQWFRPDGVLALLPLPGNRVSMVWSTRNDMAERLLAMVPEDVALEVELAARHVLGAMSVITPPRSFPLSLLRVSEWVRPRLALIGDAAHSVHPLAGQGVNLGFQDAAELARVLRERGAQDDCGDYRLLRRYERARREPVAMMQATTDGLQRLFDTTAFGVKWLRNTGLRLTNGVVPLKSFLVEHALS